MATVYLAHDVRHDRPVALKVLHPELAHALGPERFQREIRLAARLQHPHILTVHDSGETAGQLWFTMPFVEGESLRDRLNREKQRNDSALSALAAGSAAILTPTHASAQSLSIVAAAFGLTTAINDAAFQSYLFTEAPGLIANKVKDLQDVYQKSLTQASIATADQAYSAIQHFYSICLPESIEGVLLEAVASSTAKVKTGGQNGTQTTGTVASAPKLTVSHGQPCIRRDGCPQEPCEWARALANIAALLRSG